MRLCVSAWGSIVGLADAESGIYPSGRKIEENESINQGSGSCSSRNC
jgi:hypothetical protein